MPLTKTNKINTFELFLLAIVILPSIAWGKDFKIFAHRGASGYLPEHSLPSAALAHGFNPDYIEPDLVLTKDNHLIVIHDIHLDSTTNVESLFPKRKRKDGRYYAIDFTLAEIKKLSLNERQNKKGQPVFKSRFPQTDLQLRIPTFEQFVDLIEGLNKSRRQSVGIIPEIKAPEFHKKEGKDILRAFMKFYETKKPSMEVILQCFHSETLKRLKKEFPSAPFKRLQLIADDSWGEASDNYSEMLTQKGLKNISKYADAIGPWIPQLVTKPKSNSATANSVTRWAQKAGLKVYPYTFRKDALPPFAKTPKTLMHFLKKKAKVDGVFTDFPDI